MPALIVPLTLTSVVTNFVPPGANEVSQARVFSTRPCLSSLVVCKPARNSFRSDLMSSCSNAAGLPPRSVGQSRFAAMSSLRVVS